MITLPAFLDGTAACTGTPALWDSALPQAEQQAVAICRTCPLQHACATHALTTPEPLGTWGGLTARERRRLLRPGDESWLDEEGRIRRPCGTDAAYWAHRRYKEACETCEAARVVRLEERRRRSLEMEHAKGGTVNGAAIHRRLGEEVCAQCRAAGAQHSAAQRAARPRRPCGDYRALLAHVSLGEECEVCRTAQAERTHAARLARLAAEHEAGGTVAGARIHRLLKQRACERCRAAQRRARQQKAAGPVLALAS